MGVEWGGGWGDQKWVGRSRGRRGVEVIGDKECGVRGERWMMVGGDGECGGEKGKIIMMSMRRTGKRKKREKK